MSTPRLLSTWSFSRRGHAAAWPALAQGGSSLDAVEHVACVTEADPDVDSVGFGGLPDRDGAVTLDAAVMRSPRECGSVCALSRHLHAVTVARAVMERTEHVMLAGAGADAFAEACGEPESDLLAPRARERWQAWRAHPAVVDQSRDAGLPRGHDTVCVLAIDADGVMSGACSTSGMAFKLPGRVGDSPLIGHALYVDPGVGAATATGTGELVMGLCSSFHAVEEMRRGASPLEALLLPLRRILECFDLEPEHQVAMVALRPDGTWSSAALRAGYKSVVTDQRGQREVESDAVLIDEA